MAGGKGGVASADHEMGDVVVAIDTFCARNKIGRSGQWMGAELIKLRHECDRLELEFSETAAQFAATSASERDGANTPIDWIRHHCQMGSYAAAERACVGAQIPLLPRRIDAVANSEIRFAHLALLARTANALSAPDT